MSRRGLALGHMRYLVMQCPALSEHTQETEPHNTISDMGLVAGKPVFGVFVKASFKTGLLSYRDYLEN